MISCMISYMISYIYIGIPILMAGLVLLPACSGQSSPCTGPLPDRDMEEDNEILATLKHMPSCMNVDDMEQLEDGDIEVIDPRHYAGGGAH